MGEVEGGRRSMDAGKLNLVSIEGHLVEAAV